MEIFEGISLYALIVVNSLQATALFAILRSVLAFRFASTSGMRLEPARTPTQTGGSSVSVEEALSAEEAPRVEISPILGNPLPSFQVPFLLNSGLLTDKEFRGKASMILALGEHSVVMQMATKKVLVFVSYVWKKVNGKVYVVCSDTNEHCREFFDKHRETFDFFEDDVQVVVDPLKEVTTALKLESDRPVGVLVDELGYVRRVGRVA